MTSDGIRATRGFLVRHPTSLRPRIPRTPLLRLALCATALLLPVSGANAAELHGRVVGVSDGDTISVLDEWHITHKVRLAGIDAPERKQPYGAQARQHLAGLVFGKSVAVTWHKRDWYGRLIGEVRLRVTGACGQPDCARAEDVGLAQIESGLAWHYRQYQNEQTMEQRRRYALAEQSARAKREGLWKDARPVPPWEYRSSQRAAGTPAASSQPPVGSGQWAAVRSQPSVGSCWRLTAC